MLNVLLTVQPINEQKNPNRKFNCFVGHYDKECNYFMIILLLDQLFYLLGELIDATFGPLITYVKQLLTMQCCKQYFLVVPNPKKCVDVNAE